MAAIASLLASVGKLSATAFKIDTVTIDNFAFKLYYKWTTTMLLFSSMMVTAKQYFGSPIQCDAGNAASGVEKDVLEAYCWMYATFDIPSSYKGQCSAGDQDYRIVNNIVYNSYYQWIPIYLVALTILFYMPRLIWMSMEGGLMHFFGKGTTGMSWNWKKSNKTKAKVANWIEDQDVKKEKLVHFFMENIRNKYNAYFVGFIFCELLNITIAISTFALTHKFLRHKFLRYGLETVAYYNLPDEEYEMPGIINPMCTTFPRVASCNYIRWGPAGVQENVNSICILGLNVINDKIFLVLWFWLSIVLVISFFNLILRIVTCTSSCIRYQMLRFNLLRFFKKSKQTDKIKRYIYNCQIGDWFVLQQLSKNLNRPFFMEFLTEICVRYGEKKDAEDVDDDEKSTHHPLVNFADLTISMMTPRDYLSQESAKPKSRSGKSDEDDDDDD